MADIDPDRFEAAVNRVSFIVLNRTAKRRFPEIETLNDDECETVRRRACIPYAAAKMAKRLWARGHTIAGEPPVNGFW
jgi:hypothetical protein